MEGFFGKELEVLMEEEVEIDGVRYWTGHTREYLRVAVLSEENLMNQMVLVTPSRIHGKELSDVGNDTDPEDLIEKEPETKKFVALFEGSW